MAKPAGAANFACDPNNPATCTDVTSVFELADGNTVDAGANAIDDWDTLHAGGGSAVVQTTGTPDPDSPAVNDPKGQSIFTQGGSKDDLDILQWRHTDGNVPDKDEIVNAGAALYITPMNEQILVFFADRFTTNGDAQIGFWFFQDTVSRNMDGSGTFDGQHQIGDILVLSNFTNGGTQPNIRVYRWDPTDPNAENGTLVLIGSAGACNAPAIPGVPKLGCAEVNSGALAGSPLWPFLSKQGATNYAQAGSFFEGGVNLTALLPAGASVCLSSFLAETRSSASTDATLKDLVGPSSFPAGAEAVAGPDRVIDCTAVDGQITLHGSSSTPGVTLNWTTSDGNIVSQMNVATGPGETAARDAVVDAAGTYTLTATTGTGCTGSDDVVVTVDLEPPGVMASKSNDLDCDTTSATLSATSPVMASFEWFGPSPDGGVTPGPSIGTGAMINVMAPGIYTVVATGTGNGCTSSAQVSVGQDITPPSLTIEKTAEDGTNLNVSLGLSAGSAASYQWQSCVAMDCSNSLMNANWVNVAGQMTSSLSQFSNFELDTPSAISFQVNGVGPMFVGRLWVVNLRLVGTGANGCVAPSNVITVQRVNGVDP
ncbi:MAG TPA: hypothetical protein VF064_03215 [Pyrinomonadaceae bacterium]